MRRCMEERMKNEQEKSNNRLYIGIVIVALAFCAAYFLRSCGDGAGTAEVHQRTDTTVERIEKEHTNAGRELDTVGAELDSAGTAVGRADELVDRSQERITENTASINECQRIVGECRKIIADCNRIYCEVEEANRSGTGSGGGS